MKMNRNSVQPQIRLDFIDGLRAIACLMVILCHLDFLAPWSFLFTINGHAFSVDSSRWFLGFVGVNLFLVLSGFCLYWPLVRPGRKTEPSLAEFAKRRARRILPPYYVACLLAALTAIVVQRIGSSDALFRDRIGRGGGGFLLQWLGVHAVLMQTTVPNFFDKLLGQVWSIALEAQCYLLFPLFVEALKRINARYMLVSLALANALYRWSIVHYAGLSPETWDALFPLVNNVFGRCFEFAAGMFAARCVSEWSVTGRFPFRFYDLLAVLPSLWIVGRSAIAPHHAPRMAPLFDVAWGVCFCVLVVVSSRAFFIRRLLSIPILVWAGEISYSVYLVHGHILVIAIYLVHFDSWRGPLPLVGCLLIIPICFAVGYGFFLLFEKPFLSRSSPPLITVKVAR